MALGMLRIQPCRLGIEDSITDEAPEFRLSFAAGLKLNLPSPPNAFTYFCN